MKNVIKVKIVSSERDSYWYAGKIGQVIDVRKTAYGYEWLLKTSHFLEVSDCVELTAKEALQIDLQTAKNNVAELEKQLAEEAEREATRPFTQEEYEKVVAQFRKCAGRKVFEVGTSNYGVEISTYSGISYDNYSAWISFALFGVWFDSENSVVKAIKEVGEENLREACSFEMSIGL